MEYKEWILLQSTEYKISMTAECMQRSILESITSRIYLTNFAAKKVGEI